MLHSAPRPPIVLEGPYVNLELAVLALVLGSLAVTAVCRRLGVSSALVLVLAGLAASLIPGVIEVTFDPQVVLLLVLTPLLYSAALDSSYLGIRANKRPIGLLAVGLVTFTAVVVGVVASWLIPGLPLAAGLVLGAVVAPPDAVSALAVGRRLNLPRRVMTILGGESLINDATAPGTVYRRMRREMLNAERDVFVARRDAGEIDDEILRRVLRELDFEEATLDRDGG